ncbi:hypothetical protein Q4519_21725 [Motilimonas sp. 1_MG-2023]|uniref:hypothetical protein n=1 Tax=Motilimonas sp. 1_MG-2023 TaxID=3062672 RepID=UPI0026E2BC14|nr:hypothetical protein [Motilimonas sp. 1_MG-2023]MDO6528271.1 hypothetical protein [Motilimonas sp. 1_MG-2023]
MAGVLIESTKWFVDKESNDKVFKFLMSANALILSMVIYSYSEIVARKTIHLITGVEAEKLSTSLDIIQLTISIGYIFLLTSAMSVVVQLFWPPD